MAQAATEVQTFNHPLFGELRAINEQEPLFVATDVCKTLEIRNTTQALQRLDDDERSMLNIGRQGMTNMVTFPGLLSLVLGSRKKEAREYKRWVTHEVLPAIHRTGGYMIAKADETPEETMARAVLIAQDTINRQKQQIADMQPKALFADAVAASHTSILVGELAKLLKQNGVEIGQNRLFKWLRENGYLMKAGSSYNMPTQRSMEQELFEVKETSITHSDGHITVQKTPKVTGKGQQYFINRFLTKGEVA